MNLKISGMEIKNFKGIKEASYKFDDVTRFSGANATGKTTIATAFMWLFADCDYDLKNNPPIFPMNTEECTPMVTIACTINDKPVRLSKMQTRRVTESNGVRKESYTNNYTINDVPKSLTDFKAYLVEHEISMEHFLALSHPEVFCSEKKDEQRKVLFGMVASITDLDVATNTDGVEALAELLQNYTLEEVQAMNKRTLKEIDENYGKHGEILKAKIEGLEMARSNADIGEAELGLRASEEELANIEYQIKELTQASDDYSNLSKEIVMLKSQQMKLKDRDSHYLDVIEAKRKTVYELKDKKVSAESTVRTLTSDIENIRNRIKDNEAKIAEHKTKIVEFEKVQIRDADKICPTCGREYPADKIEEIKSTFENKRAKAIESRKVEIDTLAKEIGKMESEARTMSGNLDESTESLIAINAKLKTAEDEVTKAIESKPNVEDSTEYKELSTQIAESEMALTQIKSKIDSIAGFNEKARIIRSEIVGFKETIAKADTSHIDAEIDNLRKAQINYEQKRADAENIKYQIELLNASKNLKLEESVNQRFDLVKFKLFETLKNGETKDACIPTIDGKALDTHCNRGYQTLAKLDIIKGLQDFYDEHYPIFLDNAESLSGETKARIKPNSQIVFLEVSEDKALVQA